jgi:AraC-like DNA-binding protein
MQPNHYLPPASLAPYIAFYSILESEETISETLVSPPLGLCGIIIFLEGEPTPTLNGKPFMKHQCCATGQITQPMIVPPPQVPLKEVLVFMHPCGLYQLFGIDMQLLTNTSLPLTELLGDEDCSKLITELKTAPTYEDIIEIMNNFFIKQLPVFEIAPAVKTAIDYIHTNKGNISIKELEKTCFSTTRSLERHFKKYIGLSPNEYAKIYRFKCLINYINEHPNVSWEVLCNENGYYDQSHLTRYFTKYLNMKPNDLVKTDMEFLTYLLQA